MIVYVVTTGSYSDYGIHSIWTKEDDAKNLVKILNVDSYREADYYECELDKPYKERVGYRVLLDLTSGLETDNDIYHQETGEMVLEESPNVRIWADEEHIRLHEGTWVCPRFSLHPDENLEPVVISSEHETKEQALKAAYDFRAATLAKLQGI